MNYVQDSIEEMSIVIYIYNALGLKEIFYEQEINTQNKDWE